MSKAFGLALTAAMVAALVIVPAAGAKSKTIHRQVQGPFGPLASQSSFFLNLKIPKKTKKNGVKYKVTKVKDVNVDFRMNHNTDQHIDIHLLSPFGRAVELSTDNGANGNNYGSGSNICGATPTLFNDEAANPIQGGAAPFAGEFRPEVPLSTLDGGKAPGKWFLAYADDTAATQGSLGCYSLHVRVKLKGL